MIVHSCDSQPSAANVIFPVREDVEVFAAAVNVMLPLPLPDILFSVSHDAFVETLHAVFDITEILFELTPDPTDLLAGSIESE